MCKFPHIRKLALVCSLAGMAFALVKISASEKGASQSGVVLALSSTDVEPTTTFELRFDEAIAGDSDIGHPAKVSPLQFHPAAKGEWIWLSPRNGVFTPTEPLALGTTYRLTLTQGLAKPDGKPVHAELEETVHTPPMRVNAFWPDHFPKENAPSQPEVMMLLNADVLPDSAAKFIAFESEDGQRVAASVRFAPAKRYFPLYHSTDHTLLTWRERFEQARLLANLDARHNAMPWQTREEMRNCLLITPAQPLPVGHNWKLAVASGLPGTETDLRMPAGAELKIGDVTPFELRNATAQNLLNESKRIELNFSKTISPKIKPELVEKWIRVSPFVPNLRAEVSGSRVVLTGDFSIQKYSVTVASGFPAVEPFTLVKDEMEEVAFAPIPARLYFPDFTAHQLSNGSRELPLLVVNVPNVRLRAKWLDPEKTVFALHDFRDYFASHHRWNDNEPFSEVDFKTITGRVAVDKEIAGTSETDEQQIVPIKWDELLAGRKTGAVFLTAEEPGDKSGRKGTQAVVQLTDLGMVWKCSDKQAFVHVFSQANGKSIGGAKVRLLDEKGAMLCESETDTQGVATLALKEGGNWLLAQNGDDFHVIEFGEERQDVSLYHFKLRRDYDDNAASGREVMLFSDRDAYRPGETLQLKAIVRDQSDKGLKIPAGEAATLRCYDSRGRKFFEKSSKISADGSLAESIKLPNGATGRYRAQLHFANESGDDENASFSHEFQVEEFQPNAFEIKLRAPEALTAGQAFTLPITASYYMGKALSKAKIHWSIEANDTGFAPAGFGDYFFCGLGSGRRDDDDDDNLGLGSTEVDLQGDGELSPQGEFSISPEIKTNPKQPQPREITVLAEITDIDQQTVSHSATFTQQSSEFYLGVKKFDDVLRVGEAVPVEVIAVGADGKPLSQIVNTAVKLTRVDWETNRVEGAGGSNVYSSRPNFELVSQTQMQTSPLRREGERWMTANRKVTELRVKKPGLYLLEASAKDSAGHDVLTRATFHVSGDDELAWDYKNDFQIKLVADKTEYSVGETAKLLVKTPLAGDAWVTIEREKVLRSFVTHLEGNAPSIQLPLEIADAPNVFVSVMILRGAKDGARKVKQPDYRLGYCELKVTNPHARLAVQVQTERHDYEPAQQVAVKANVQDFAGAPAADAEVTLYAVDEGVLSLTDYQTPDPFAFFNAPRGLAIRTGLTLPKLLPEDPDERTFENKGYVIGGGGIERAEQIRQNFQACAFWSTTLRTDAHGHVTAVFTAPDSLTRYRVIAVVQTARNQFGSGQSEFVVSKPLMLEPSLPRFGNVGDKLKLRAVLHNQTDIGGEAEVALDLDNTVTTTVPLKRKIALAARGSAAIDFPVEFTQTGEAKWTWHAKMLAPQNKVFTDAVQTKLHVDYPAPLIRQVHFANSDAASANLLEGFDPELLGGSGTIRVSISNSRMIDLLEPMRELLHYPYGCVEQTTSSTLPWLTLRDFQNVLPDLQKSPGEIEDAIQHGVNRLLSMQTPSGGLAYWPGEREPLLWASAYGGFGLVLAKRGGHFVPEEKFDALCKYISAELRGMSEDSFDGHYGNHGPSDRCLAVYTLALAGKAEPAYHELLFQQRDHLSAENRALLALAILESNGSREMAAELLNCKLSQNADDEFFGCGSREIALQLMAWTQLRANDNHVDALIDELIGARSGGNWGTTQGNAWSMLALTSYVQRVERGAFQAAGSIAWGTQSEKFDLESKATMHESALHIDPAKQREPLILANPARTKLFTQVALEARPRTIAQPRRDNGYAIQRSYQKIEDDGTLTDLKQPHVGDRVLVTLRIEVRDRANYIAIDDPLPSIFEAVNPEFKSQQTRAGETVGLDWLSDYRELREDRALFFRDHIWPGTYTVHYLARVRAAGTATAPSAKIEEMYHPDRFGLSGTLQVTSLSLE